MAYIQGTDRLQTALFCLEDFIAPDAPVRVIDAFCAQVDYITLDFRGKSLVITADPTTIPLFCYAFTSMAI
jgi:hypothetical protein